MATGEIPKSCREPLPEPKRKRLEKIFEAAKAKASAASGASDFDYPADLLGQCVNGDPGNPYYVQAYLENLHKKYGNPKKISPLAQLRERGARSAQKKALAQEQWDEVIAQGLKVLVVNPWDMTALTAMATAAQKCGDKDCELCYLKAALVGTPKDPGLNRLYAIALRDRGLIDQAITFWHRVEEFLPGNEEAQRAIAVLTVEKARSRGGFDDDDEVSRKMRMKAQEQEEATFEQKMLKKIQQEPNNVDYLTELAQFFVNDERYNEAEDLLARAFELSDGDVTIRDKWEDVQLRHLRQQIAKAKDPAVKKKLQTEYFEKNLVVCKNRVERFPGNLNFKYELGYQYLLTKRYSEAIQELQVAKNDPRRRGVSMLALGQCFQHIKQYRLAMKHFEQAIQDIPDRDADNKKRAYYLAGRLAMAMKDIDKSEKMLTALAGMDFTYKDVSTLLDKIAELRENPESGKGDNASEG
jgi:tetratricopeptide (TPR) repeat protein